MNHAITDVARLLPDIPRWVEVRSMLLAGHARFVGDVRLDPVTFVVLHRDEDQAVVVGRAPKRTIAEAAKIAGEFLVAPEDESWLRDVLPDWRYERATLYLRSSRAPLPVGRSEQVRFLADGELERLRDLPHDLRSELLSAERTPVPIAVVYDGAMPAAFAYAGSITETLWDVSIDTLAPFRRRGHAARAAAFLIAHYAGRGKSPVWGALLSNRASMALAAHLGFSEVDSLSVASAPAQRP